MPRAGRSDQQQSVRFPNLTLNQFTTRNLNNDHEDTANLPRGSRTTPAEIAARLRFPETSLQSTEL